MKAIWPKVPALFVRAMLASHSAAGLFFAAAAYLICLTGTIAVFADELRRWELPIAGETRTYSAKAVARAAENAVDAAGAKDVHAVVVRLPSESWPRLTASVYGAREKTWIASADGALAAEHEAHWSEFVRELHVNLNVPGSIGYFVVGLVGVGMLALAISGAAAHPRIFRDAFALRWGGSRRLQEADLHNRLSVWGLPFNIAISLTGAYFGLVGFLMMLVAGVAYDGDTTPLLKDVSPPHPKETHVAAPFPDVAAMLAKVAADPLNAEAFSVYVEHPMTTGWHAGVYAKVPKHLAYGELFHFRGDGDGRVHHVDGSFGQQMYIASYPLHFGDFGGLPVKLLYGALGLGLSVVCAGGVSIWLARRRDQGRPAVFVDRLWAATVWGAPLALAGSAIAALLFAALPIASFWAIIALCCAAVFLAADEGVFKRALRLSLAFALLALATLHFVVHEPSFAGTAFWVNVALLVVAALIAGTTPRAVVMETQRAR